MAPPLVCRQGSPGTRSWPRAGMGEATTATLGPKFGPPDGFTPGSGMLRGMFDYRGTRRARKPIASVTDGTSNTAPAGEILPSRAADANFWFQNGNSPGSASRLNWNSNTPSIPVYRAANDNNWQAASAPLGCRFGSAAPRASSAWVPAARASPSATARCHLLESSLSAWDLHGTRQQGRR